MVYASCAYYMARWMQEADFKNNQMNVDYNESDMGNAERRVMGEWRECYDAKPRILLLPTLKALGVNFQA